MQVDKRATIQNDAYEAWDKKGRKGTVEIATGIGKTFIALHALHSMPKDDKIHLFLAEVSDRKKDLIENIKKYDEIFNCNTSTDYNLQFHCYQSVRNWKATSNIGLVIADEIHDALTPVNSLFFENNRYDALLGLSAKIDLNTSYKVKRGIITITITKEMYLNMHAPIVYKYSMKKAREDNLNRDLTIHIIHHELEDKELTVKSGSSKSPFLQTEKKAYEFWNSKYIQSAKIKDYIKRQAFQRLAASKRSNILYNLNSKVIASKKLLKHIDRTAIFSNSINALLKVTPYTVTSRNSDAQNNYYRNRFDNGLCDTIGSFKKLKQGANMVNLKNMILMSYYSKEKDAIQRLGRLRVEEDNKGDVFIFVTKNTMEVEWCKAMLMDIDIIYNIVEHDGIDNCITHLNNGKSK